uniref:Uncharacterized protein n=1 Tax=Arundo donax TaxID=35708 RepID=A0A0A8ZJJ9_ARUDO
MNKYPLQYPYPVKKLLRTRTCAGSGYPWVTHTRWPGRSRRRGAVLGAHGHRGPHGDCATDEGHGGLGRLVGARQEEVATQEVEGGHEGDNDMDSRHEVLL